MVSVPLLIATLSKKHTSFRHILAKTFVTKILSHNETKTVNTLNFFDKIVWEEKSFILRVLFKSLGTAKHFSSKLKVIRFQK